MQQEFADEVRQALAQAREEAIALAHDYIGTEHILLGLLATPGAAGMGLLDSLGVTADQVRGRIEESIRPGAMYKSRTLIPNAPSIAAGELPYTTRGKQALAETQRIAEDLEHARITTEHVLLGLLADGKSIATVVLNSFGVNAENARAAAISRQDPPLEG